MRFVRLDCSVCTAFVRLDLVAPWSFPSRTHAVDLLPPLLLSPQHTHASPHVARPGRRQESAPSAHEFLVEQVDVPDATRELVMKVGHRMSVHDNVTKALGSTFSSLTFNSSDGLPQVIKNVGFKDELAGGCPIFPELAAVQDADRMDGVSAGSCIRDVRRHPPHTRARAPALSYMTLLQIL